ncbi:zinc-ribbon domain-containing protein [Yoonia sp. MH D7]
MRLICPNCGAQYEVADGVIPPNGRDVQCSNCAHTWFKTYGTSDDDDDFSDDIAAPIADIDDENDVDDDDSDDLDGDVEPWGAEVYAAQPAAPVRPAPKPAPQRQELNPAIADILREEAAREAATRRAEAEAMENQPDLGLDSANAAPDQRSAEAQERMAALKGEPAPPVPSRAAIAAASRGDLLPDIEEINSSLRSATERGMTFPDPLPEPKMRKRGARRGFFGMLLILGILAAIYIFSSEIREMVPAVDGPLTTYVDTVDNGRLWLDEKLRSAVDAMVSEDAASAPQAEPAPQIAPTVSTDAPEMATPDTPAITE